MVIAPGVLYVVPMSGNGPPGKGYTMYDTIIETHDMGHGVTIEIHMDPEPFNPRTEYDGHVGTMSCSHGSYDLGDREDDPRDSDAETMVGFIREVIESAEGEGAAEGAIALPLYLYDHSGISMSVARVDLLAGEEGTNPFNCPWDSGMVGFIFVTAAKIDEEWGCYAGTDKGPREWAMDYLVGEVKEYDHYLTGQVYGFVVKDERHEVADSCWGFLGDSDYVLDAAKESAAYVVEDAEARAVARRAAAYEDLTHGTPMMIAS